MAGYGIDLIILDIERRTDDAVDRIESGIDLAVARSSGGAFASFAVHDHGHAHFAGAVVLRAVGDEVIIVKRHVLLGNQAGNIFNRNVFLAVGELFELDEHRIQTRVVQIVAMRMHEMAESASARMFAKYQPIIGRNADARRVHDFIGLPRFQEAILMDAGFVQEAVGAGNRLHRRDFNAGNGADQFRGFIDFFGNDIGLGLIKILTRIQRHHHFFQRSITGALAETIHRHFDLRCARQHAGQRIGGRHAQIIMAVQGNVHLLHPAHVLLQITNQFKIFLRQSKAHGIWHVNHRRPRLDHRRIHLHQKIPIGARRILAGKLHIIDKSLRIRHHFHRPCQTLLARDFQLVLKVNIAGCDKRMNPRMFGIFKRLRRAFNIAFHRARQRTDNRLFDRFSHGLHRLEIAIGSNGKARFDHVHAQRFEMLRDRDFVFLVHRYARGLFAVAHGGIKNFDGSHRQSSKMDKKNSCGGALQEFLRDTVWQPFCMRRVAQNTGQPPLPSRRRPRSC